MNSKQYPRQHNPVSEVMVRVKAIQGRITYKLTPFVPDQYVEQPNK
jgi:hypothetical protein